MDCPKHDIAWVGALSIVSVVEDHVPEGEHQQFMRKIYRRVMAALEAFEAYSNQIYEIEPSDS